MEHFPGEDGHVQPSLGLYVLGALHGRERSELEDHLLHCEPCRIECDELSEVSGLLALLSEDDVQAVSAPSAQLVSVVEEPPAPAVKTPAAAATTPAPAAVASAAEGTIAAQPRTPGRPSTGPPAQPGGTRRPGAGRPSRRPVRLDSKARLAVVVAVVALLAGVGIGVWLPEFSSPPPVQSTLVASATDQTSGASLTVLVGAQPSGSSVRATVAGLRPGGKYQLFAVTVDGKTEVVGEWVGTARPQTISGELAVRPARLAFFTVTLDGAAVVSAQVSGDTAAGPD